MKLFFIITSFCWATVCLAIQQQLIFHTELDCTGDGLILQSKQTNVQSEAARIVSTHKSFSVIGWWYLFANANYTSRLGYFQNNGSNVCYNNRSHPATQSLRYLGPPDTTTHSLTLYEVNDYQGQERTITGPASNNFEFDPKSLVSTGNTSWTFYTGNDFDGVATCYTPPDPLYLGWFYGLYTLNSTLSNVRSILRGCNRHIDYYFSP